MVTLSTIKRAIKNRIMESPKAQKKREAYISYIRSCYDYSLETPTIICSNCIGGMLSHNLGLKFMSPTINLWLIPSDLVKLCCNLDKYLSAELEFEKIKLKDHPVAMLGDIKLFFQHYIDDNAAREKWEARKKRINPENLYIITDDKGLSEDEIKRLESVKCKRLIIFTSKPRDDSHFFLYNCYKGHKNVGAYSVKGFDGFAPFEREFNYAAWLSGRDDLRMPKESQYVR